jgi:hypothetical protein
MRKCQLSMKCQLADPEGLSAAHYGDKYAGNVARDITSTSFDPLIPTVDAIFAESPGRLGLIKRTAGNLAFASTALDMGKYIHLLSNIVEVTVHARQRFNDTAAESRAASRLIES